jgi:hypothetical protein
MEVTRFSKTEVWKKHNRKEPLIGGPELELHLLAPVLHLGEEGVPLPITVGLHLSAQNTEKLSNDS